MCHKVYSGRLTKTCRGQGFSHWEKKKAVLPGGCPISQHTWELEANQRNKELMLEEGQPHSYNVGEVGQMCWKHTCASGRKKRGKSWGMELVPILQSD